MLEISIHIPVQKGNMVQIASRSAVKQQRCVLCHLSRRIGNPADYSNLLSIIASSGNHLSRFSAAEYGNMSRRLGAEAGPVQRIMVAMNQKHRNAVPPQFMKRLLKTQLPLQ
ncbi:hypothetical protein D3C75_847170 [compost metagenome]